MTQPKSRNDNAIQGMSVTFVTKTCTNVTAIKQKRLTINMLQKSLVTFGTYFCTKVTGLDRTDRRTGQAKVKEEGEGEGKEERKRERGRGREG